jgi:hypothetical protein
MGSVTKHVATGIVFGYFFKVPSVKRKSHVLFKHQKSHDILSFIIHWNVFQFVEAMSHDGTN